MSSRRISSRYPARRPARKYMLGRRSTRLNPGAYHPIARGVSQSSMYGFPSSIYYSHRQFDQLTLNPTSGSVDYARYQVNYPYNAYSGGHQPYAFDQLSAIYQFYTVYSVDITFTVLPSGANGIGAAIVPQRDATIYSSIETLNELPGAVSKYVPVDQPLIIKKHLDLSELLGVPKLFLLHSGNYTGVDTTSPSQGAYATMYVMATGAAVDPPAQPVMIDIVYNMLWRGPRSLASS